MQTISILLFRLQESGLGSLRKLKKKKKKMASFLHQGKRARQHVLLLIIRFRQFFSNFLKVVKNHLNVTPSPLPKSIFPFTPRIRISKKNADPKPWYLHIYIYIYL